MPLTTWTTGSTTATGTSLPWKIRTSISTVTTGASGVLEPNGDLIIKLSGTATSSVYQDTSLTTTSGTPIDLSAALFLDISVHANGTGQTAQVRQMIVQPVN